MKKFLKRWIYRYITYRVTMKYLARPRPILCPIEIEVNEIQIFVANIYKMINLRKLKAKSE